MLCQAEALGTCVGELLQEAKDQVTLQPEMEENTSPTDPAFNILRFLCIMEFWLNLEI